MSAQDFKLLDGTFTGDFESAPGVPINTATMGQVTVKISTATGTITDLTIWLQGRDLSGDGEWVDLLADQVLKTVNAAVGGTPGANLRDIVDGKSTTTAESFVAIYKHLPCEEIRIRGKLSGTTPAVPLKVTFSGK